MSHNSMLPRGDLGHQGIGVGAFVAHRATNAPTSPSNPSAEQRQDGPSRRRGRTPSMQVFLEPLRASRPRSGYAPPAYDQRQWPRALSTASPCGSSSMLPEPLGKLTAAIAEAGGAAERGPGAGRRGPRGSACASSPSTQTAPSIGSRSCARSARRRARGCWALPTAPLRCTAMARSSSTTNTR